MKNLKVALFFSLTVGIVAGITGCSNVNVINVPHPTVVSLKQLESKYSASNPVRVDFWTGFGSDMTKALTNEEGTGVIDTFEEKYPFIDVVHESKGGYTNLQKAVTLGTTNRTYPNIAVGYPDHFAGYISSNIQYELDTFIDSEEYGMNLGLFNPQFLKENQELVYKDEEKTKPYTMGIPFNKSTEVLVYNETFFNHYNLTVPNTWEEVKTVSRQALDIVNGIFEAAKNAANEAAKTEALQVKDAQGKIILDFSGLKESNEFYPISWDSQSNFFITVARQWGGKYTSMESVEKGYIEFSKDEKVKEALSYFIDMHRAHILGIPETWDEEQYCSEPFKALKSIMTVSSSAGIKNNIPSGSKFSVGIKEIPYYSADNKYVISQGTNLCLFKGSADETTAAWLLLQYLTEGDGNVDFAVQTGYLPVTSGTITVDGKEVGVGEESTYYKTFLESYSPLALDKCRQQVAKIAKNDYTDAKGWTKFVDPAFRGSSTVREEVGNVFPMLFYDNYTPDTIMTYLEGQLSRFVH